MNRRTGGMKFHPIIPANAIAAAIDNTQYRLLGFFTLLELVLALLLLLDAV